MDPNKPESQDESDVDPFAESDDDPFAELESILSGSQQKSSQKEAGSSSVFTSDDAIMEALQRIESLLQNSLEAILNDEELKRQLHVSLECIQQASDEKVSPDVAKLAESMASSVEDMFKSFALNRKVVEDHTSRLQQKERLVKRTGDGRKRLKWLNEKVSQCVFEAERLDRDAEELDEKIRLLVEQKKIVEMKQTEVKKNLEEYDGDRKKLKDEAKNLVMESKQVMFAIQNSQSSYDAALSEQGKLNGEWEEFRRAFANQFESLSMA